VGVGVGRKVGKLNGYLVGADHNLLDEVLNDLMLLLEGEVSPSGVEALGFGQDLVGGEVLDAEEVHLALETRNLFVQLAESLVEGPVEVAEGFRSEAVIHVGSVDFPPLGFDGLVLALQPLKEFFLFPNLAIGLVQVGGHLLRREEETLELLFEDGLQINGRDFVAAARAHVLGRV